MEGVTVKPAGTALSETGVNRIAATQNLAFEEIRWAYPADLPTFDFLEGDAELISLLSQGKLPLLQSQP